MSVFKVAMLAGMPLAFLGSAVVAAPLQLGANAANEGTVKYLGPPPGGSTNNLFYFDRISDLTSLDVTPITEEWIAACVERDEFIAGTTYYGIVNTQAIAGGVNTNSGDPLDERTAYLYSKFRDGSLGSIDLDPGAGTLFWTNTDANRGQLQQAIWYLEEELASLPSGSLAQKLVDKANAATAGGNPEWDGLGLVRVLNLYAFTVNGSGNAVLGAYQQDQLVLLKGNFEVPTPAAAGGVIGLLALGLFGRRRSA